MRLVGYVPSSDLWNNKIVNPDRTVSLSEVSFFKITTPRKAGGKGTMS